jgi:hypothetical protein
MASGNSDMSRLQSLNGFWHVVAEAPVPRVPLDLLLPVENRAGQAGLCNSQAMVCAALRLVCYGGGDRLASCSN